jgi:hypothetical protein
METKLSKPSLCLSLFSLFMNLSARMSLICQYDAMPVKVQEEK